MPYSRDDPFQIDIALCYLRDFQEKYVVCPAIPQQNIIIIGYLLASSGQKCQERMTMTNLKAFLEAVTHRNKLRFVYFIFSTFREQQAKWNSYLRTACLGVVY